MSKKLVYTDGTKTFVDYEAVASHVVCKTAKDTKAPWLCLRHEPISQKNKKCFAELPDGTQLNERKRNKKGTWSQVDVLSGKDKGKNGWVYNKFLCQVATKTQPVSMGSATKTTGKKADFEVFNTAQDVKEPFLVLHKAAPGTKAWDKEKEAVKAGKKEFPGKLIDGTLVKKISKRKRKKFYRLEVVSGQYAGARGWARDKFLRVPRVNYKKAVVPTEYEYDNSTALARIRDEFTADAVGVVAGTRPYGPVPSLKNFQLVKRTVVPKAHYEMAVDNDIASQQGFAFYNQEIDAFTFALPFCAVSREEMRANPQTISNIIDVHPPENHILFEPFARKVVFIEAMIPQLGDYWEDVYSKTGSREHLANTMVNFSDPTDPLARIINNMVEEFLGITKNLWSAFLKDMTASFAKNYISVEMDPANPSQTPRWITLYIHINANLFMEYAALKSYYLPRKIKPPDSFNFKAEQVKSSTPNQRIFTDAALGALTLVTDGTLFGVDLLHGMLGGEYFQQMAKRDDYSIVTVDIPSLKWAFDFFQRKLATVWKTLDKQQITPKYGPTEENAKPVQSMESQRRFLRNFVSMLKASVQIDNLTAEAAESADNLTLSLVFKTKINNGFFEDMELVNIFVEPSPTSQKTGLSYKLPVLTSTNINTGVAETYGLFYGHLAALNTDIFPDFQLGLFADDTVNEIAWLENTLKKKPKDSKLSDGAYILSLLPVTNKVPDEIKKLTKEYVVYVLAEIIKGAVQTRQFPLQELLSLVGDGSAATMFTEEDLVKIVVQGNKLENLEDYSGFSEWTLGLAPTGPDGTLEPYKYKVPWVELLKKLGYISLVEHPAKGLIDVSLDWNRMRTKAFKQKSHEALREFDIVNFAALFSVSKQSELIDYRNYRDFLDELYNPLKIFYVPGPPPKAPISAFQKAQQEKPPSGKTGWDALHMPTQVEWAKIGNELLHKRRALVEQSFAGTGCVEEALKIADTFEDIYDLVFDRVNWPVFICKIIDRYKCEAAKLMGAESQETLECLANFDTCGVFKSAIKLEDVLEPEKFKKLFEEEFDEQPSSVIVNMLRGRDIPQIPNLDWYACIRQIILALVVKLITELIRAFILMILGIFDICPPDTKPCEMPELDPTSNDSPSDEPPPDPSGISNEDLVKAAIDLSKILNKNIDPSSLKKFMSVMSQKFTTAQFKSLIEGEPPPFIFNHAKFVANNFFQAVLKGDNFTDTEFQQLLDTISLYYNRDALIGKLLLEVATSDEACPPFLVDGSGVQATLLEILLSRLIEEGHTPESAQEAINKNKEKLNKDVNTFCEVLNGGTNLLKLMQDLPAISAGFTNAMLMKGIKELISNFRIKAYYDFFNLQWAFTHNLFGDLERDDILIADMSLAFNLIYGNYWLIKMADTSFNKNYDLYPRLFASELPYGGKIDKAMLGPFPYTVNNQTGIRSNVIKVDSFEKEFLQDCLEILWTITTIHGFAPDLLGVNGWIGELFDVKELTQWEEDTLEVSRKLNNPNYFYGWAQDMMAALVPMLDPRTFHRKYAESVDEYYPNAEYDDAEKPTPLVQPYEFKIVETPTELIFKYENTDSEGNVVQNLLDLRLRPDNMVVKIGEGNSYQRPLPQLPEPWFVDGGTGSADLLKKYSTFNSQNNTLLAAKSKQPSPQRQLFVSLCEKSSAKYLANMGAETSAISKELLEGLINPVFDAYYYYLIQLIQKEFTDNRVAATEFFLKPYIRASQLAADKAKKLKDADPEERLKMISTIGGNPPVGKFFRDAAGGASNIMTDVLFPGDSPKEATIIATKKVINKYDAALQKFARDSINAVQESGKFNPDHLKNKISTYDTTTKIYHFVEQAISAKIPNGEWLTVRELSEDQQKKILAAIMEKTQ